MIRKLQEQDIEAVNIIYNQAIEAKLNAYLQTISLTERLAWFKKRDNQLYPSFIFEQDKEVLGWLYFSPYRSGRGALAQVGEVSYYVHQQYHRQGIGYSLLKYGIEIASEYQFKHMIAILLSTNTASIRLLEKLDFEKWGKIPHIVIRPDSINADHLYYGLTLYYRV